MPGRVTFSTLLVGETLTAADLNGGVRHWTYNYVLPIANGGTVVEDCDHYLSVTAEGRCVACDRHVPIGRLP